MGTGEEEWSLDTVEVSKYYSHFHTLCPSGSLPKTNGKKFFAKLKVPSSSFSLLWNLSDVDRDGFLNTAEFCVAMYLTKQYLDGTPLPTTLPLPLKLYARQVMKLPAANDSQKNRCLEIFEQCKNHVHEGILQGKIAKFLLSKSKLEPFQLFHIWNLADSDQDGGLTLEEFRLAIHLISLAKRGIVLPTVVRSRDLLPSSFFETEIPNTSEEVLEKGESKEGNDEESGKGHLDQEQTDTPEDKDNKTPFTHQTLPLSPSWTNFEDSKFDDTNFFLGFPSSLPPILEEATPITSKQYSDPFTSKVTATNNSVSEQEEEDKSVIQEENPFRKDSFIELDNFQCCKEDSSAQPFSSSTLLVDNKTFESCDQDIKADQQEEENPFRKDSFVLFQEQQLVINKELQGNGNHKTEPSLNTVLERPSFHDPFFQDPFTSKVETKFSLDNNLVSEEEPRSKCELIAPHSEAVNLVFEQFAPFEYDPFEEEPFFSEHSAAALHSPSKSTANNLYTDFDIPPPLLESSISVDKESTDSGTQWHHFDSFDHSFDPHFDTLDRNSATTDSLFSDIDDHSVSSVDYRVVKSLRSVDLEPPAVLSVDEPDISSDKMAVDANAIPDIQDLDNTFSLDDLTSVIAEMELVTESLNEEPTPPPVVEKPKKPSPSIPEKPKKAFPPVPAKKKPPTKSNEQSTKKPQSFLNEVNVQKSKEKGQQIQIDIAGDVFSELEEQLQQELMARSDQVPDEVKEVLKELNAPYTMGLENLEADLGVKSGDSGGNVGDLISELHGMGDFENLDEEGEPKQNEDKPSSELAESGLTDAYAESSVDDLLSELKGMDDSNSNAMLPPPTLPRPKRASKEVTPIEQDPLADFDINLDDELASITNTISGFSANPPAANPPAPQQKEVNYDMTEVSYQEALVEHRWKKMEKEQTRREKEATEVEMLNQESDMALKSLDEEMQSLLMSNQSSNNNTDGAMVLRRVKISTNKELKPVRRKSSLAEMWEETVSQRTQESKKQSTGVNILQVEREEALSRELELQKERKSRWTPSASTDN